MIELRLNNKFIYKLNNYLRKLIIHFITYKNTFHELFDIIILHLK